MFLHIIYNMEKRKTRNLISGRNIKRNTIFKKKAPSRLLEEGLLYEKFYFAERNIDGMVSSDVQAKTLEELAKIIIENDVNREGKVPDYIFRFDVITVHESLEPRHRLDESECRKFLDAVSKEKSAHKR